MADIRILRARVNIAGTMLYFNRTQMDLRLIVPGASKPKGGKSSRLMFRGMYSVPHVLDLIQEYGIPASNDELIIEPFPVAVDKRYVLRTYWRQKRDQLRRHKMRVVEDIIPEVTLQRGK